MTTRQALERRICDLCDETIDLTLTFNRTADDLRAFRSQTRGQQLNTAQRAMREAYRAEKLDLACHLETVCKEIERLSGQLAELDGRTVGRSANRDVFEDIDLS